MDETEEIVSRITDDEIEMRLDLLFLLAGVPGLEPGTS